ncbi:MAG: DDE-type integrase/transposase/recombinase [Chroococcidiopsidaceae cyanobacterium CP_BM_ER_R8_30]|nr:DDE-type integrase/transposase/recombinase [Chroococcidiopsidaceae cyanobacterium CP_BM_ER_R8_30]
MIEQDHRFIKRLVNPCLSFQFFYTARRTIMIYEAMNQIRKGQILGIAKGDILAQVEFVSQFFEVSA